MTHHKYSKVVGSIVICLLMLGGCSVANPNNNGFQASSCQGNYLKKNSELETYLTKICKRIIVFNDDPSLEYKFEIVNQNKNIASARKNKCIQISRAVLEKLKDEAQLAALISYLLVQSKPEYNNLTTFTSTADAIKYDQIVMQSLAKAGYSPLAAIELQEMYSSKKNSQPLWLSKVFLAYPVVKSRIDANRQFCHALAKGSVRSQNSYYLNIGVHE